MAFLDAHKCAPYDVGAPFMATVTLSPRDRNVKSQYDG